MTDDDTLGLPPAPDGARITITVVGYGFEAEWHIIVNSLLLQTDNRWFAHLINDGPDPRARLICGSYADRYPEHFAYAETPERHNNWGHSLRRHGIAATTTAFWATQNADNYLMPRYVEFVLDAFDRTRAKLVIFPCVHNYERINRPSDPAYSVLQVAPKRNRCDAGSLVVTSRIAKRVGWRNLDANSDGDFIEDVMASSIPPPRCAVLKNVLMVHN